MSNVIERYRSISGLEFYRTALELYTDMESYMLNDHHVPRRFWDCNVYPLLERWHGLFDLIERADDVPVYNKDPAMLERKRALQDECIHQLGRVYFELQLTIQAVWKQQIREDNVTKEAIKTRNRLNTWLELMAKEEKLLIGWKNGSRDKGSKRRFNNK